MVKTIMAVIVGFGLVSGVYATDHHKQNVRVVEKVVVEKVVQPYHVVERVEIREVPRVEKVRIIERQQVNHHDVQRVVVERVVNDHHRQNVRVEKSVSRSRGRLFGRR